MEEEASQCEDKDRDDFTWRARTLLMRTRVLKSQLKSALQSKEATLEASRSTQESMKLINVEHLKILSLKQEQILNPRQEKLNQINAGLESAKAEISNTVRTMIKDLWSLYPINEFPDRKGYSICDIHLPNSEHFEGHDETMVSVAIGYVGHLLLLLSDILDITLRFPLKYYGSRSLIYCSRKNQLFPLYVESFRSREWINFSYGINLLNLDIVQIRTHYGLPTNEPEETLANLHGLKLMLINHND